jgi:hypothetical protein
MAAGGRYIGLNRIGFGHRQTLRDRAKVAVLPPWAWFSHAAEAAALVEEGQPPYRGQVHDAFATAPPHFVPLVADVFFWTQSAFQQRTASWRT